MSESDYNVVELKDKTFIDFETRFTHIENIAKPVLEKIIRSESVEDLRPMELAAICCFFVVQHLRSKTSRTNLSVIPAEARRKFPGAIANDYPKFFSDENYDRYSILRVATEKIDKFAAHLITKRIVLFRNNSRKQIYISDNPLVLHNDRDNSPYGNIGLAVPGIEIYHPISPELVIGFLCPTNIDRVNRAIGELEKSITQHKNDLLDLGILWDQSSQSELRNLSNELDRCRAASSMLHNRQFGLLSEDHVDFLNSLQIHWSTRFIAARVQDFAFARKAMSERPDWKNPPRIEVA